MTESNDHDRDETRDALQRSDVGTPRWAKLVGVAALVLVVLLAIVLLVGGGSHGPGRHTGAETTPTDVGVHSPPAGGHE